MNKRIQHELQARIEGFARDVTEILQRAVEDALKDALPKGTGRRGRSARGGKGSSSKKAGARRGRKKRVSEDELLREVSQQGGRRKEELARSLGTPSDALTAPMRALIAAGKVKASGKARGTKYHAA